MALSRSLWQQVRVLMSAAPGTAQNITAVTAANPPVATYEGADPANGSFGVLSATGMRQLNNRVVRFANVNAGGNTAELENVKGANYPAFIAGAFEPVTFSHEFESLMNPQASGGEAEQIPAPNIHQDIEEIELGIFSALTYTFQAQWDPALATHEAVFEASQLKQPRAFEIIFKNGRITLMYGLVGFAGVPAGDRIVSSPLTITVRGFPSFLVS
jgi:hypothetical protein